MQSRAHLRRRSLHAAHGATPPCFLPVSFIIYICDLNLDYSYLHITHRHALSLTHSMYTCMILIFWLEVSSSLEQAGIYYVIILFGIIVMKRHYKRDRVIYSRDAHAGKSLIGPTIEGFFRFCRGKKCCLLLQKRRPLEKGTIVSVIYASHQ